MRARFATFVLLALACEKDPATPRPAAPASAPSGPSPATRAVASFVASVRAKELRLGAPPWQMQPLAFGRKLFVRLAGDRVEAYSMPSAELLFAHPVQDPRGTVEIAGGSVVVVGREASLRIDPGAKEPVRLPALPFLPGTVLVPDRKDSSGLWSVHSAGRLLSRQVLDISGKRSIAGVVTLHDYDGGPVTAMRDGVLIYRAGDGVRRAVPGGLPRHLKSGIVPWRLLPGRRVDQAWAVAEDGGVELWQIADRIAVQVRASLGAVPYDVASSSDYLAAVVVDEGGGASRRFRLVVLSEKGERVLGLDLPADPPAVGESWVTSVARDRHVALAESEPLVAVGGPSGVRVFALPAGSVVLSR